MFGAELTMDFGQWHEASSNCYRFQMSRDKNGDEGSYANWWHLHLGFFQEDKIEMYDAWKALELKLRREYRTNLHGVIGCWYKGHQRVSSVVESCMR
jgi:hypothetical protein